MPLPEDKTPAINEEKWRSMYPNVSLAPRTSVVDKSNVKVTSAKTVISSLVLKSPTSSPKNQNVKNTLNPVAKSVNLQGPKMSVVQPSPNTTSVSQNVVTTRKNTPSTKSPVKLSPATGTLNTTPVGAKTPTTVKTPINKCQVVGKSNIVPVKTLVPTIPTTSSQQAVLKATPAKTQAPLVKQAVVRPTTRIPQQQSKMTSSPPSVKSEEHEQPNVTVLNYSLSQHSTPKRTSNQITIEKLETPQKVPVTEKPTTNVVLQRTMKNGQVIVQNQEVSAETTLQSVVIGTTSPAVPNSKSESKTSEPVVQTLKVSEHVTLFKPKGGTFAPFAIKDVKDQAQTPSTNKQSAMTNIVSSTTNPPPPPPVPLTALQTSGRTQGNMHSPVRQSARGINQKTVPMRGARQYQSTRGQVKCVAREVTDSLISQVPPLQPPPAPSQQLMQLANEEEVSTSDASTENKTGEEIIMLIKMPNGKIKKLTIIGTIPPDQTLKNLLDKIETGESVFKEGNCTLKVSETSDVDEDYGLGSAKDVDSTENSEWETPQAEAEPGEITGLEPGEIALPPHDTLQAGLPGPNVLPKDVEDEKAKLLNRKGLLALCDSCGILSNDHSICQRCRRPLPPNCKLVPSDFDQKSRKTKPDSVTEESPKRKRIKRKPDEPVCLTISDDEELRHSRMSDENLDSNSQMSCDKEPVITEEMISEMKMSVTGGGMDSGLLDNVSEEDKILLQCRTVRIGSYKVVPKNKVLISSHGIKVTVPMVNSSELVELKILHHEIIKVLIHFGKNMPVLFFYTRPAAALKIRKALKMEDKNHYYYDTTSSDETHKRITFLPDKLDEECNTKLKSMYSSPECDLFAELSGKEANDILVKASPKEVQAFVLKNANMGIQKLPPPPQVQTPQTARELQIPFNGQNIQTIMVYPPPPEKGGIPINTEDYACLDEDQFLNDVIIDFYLKYVVEKTLSKEDRARTHVFSSFFYKRLTSKPPPKRKSMNPVENDPSASPAEKRHSRVKGWTKNVDLFSKDFIVIPINESSHWFLAIVCFPGLTGPVRVSDNTPIDNPKKKKLGDNNDKKSVLSGKQTVTIGSTTITAVQSTTMDILDDPDDRDEADGEDELMDVPDEDEDYRAVAEIKEEPEEQQQMTTRKKLQREPIKQPCILIFDSLHGASRARVVATLRDYLRVEFEKKHGQGRDFSGEVMKGSNVKCPQQTNYTDCGLYVLQYVEAFFQWPISDYHIPIKQVVNWFEADIVSRKRYEIQQLLHKLMEEQNIDIDSLNLPILSLKPPVSLVDYEDGNEEDDEDEEEMCEDDEEGMMEDEEEEYDPDHLAGMEEGEYEHEDDDPDNYPLHDDMEHEDHELDEYGELDEEEEMHDDDDDDIDDEMQEEDEDEGDKGMEDVPHNSARGMDKRKDDLKAFRITRLNKKEFSNNDSII